MSDSYRKILSRADAFFAAVTERLPEQLECRKGCTMCCHGLFEIGAADVALISDAVRSLDPVSRTELVERARAIVDNLAQPNLRDCEPAEKEAFFDRAEDVPCPALDEAGGCLIYENRPLVCRTFGLPLREGASYLGQECELNFTSSTDSDKEASAWDLEWEDVLGAEDEFTVPEAIVLASLFME